MIIENDIQPRTRSPFIRLTLTGTMLACALPLFSTTAARATEQGSNKHNILFIILDDVGADQLNVSNPVGKALGTLPVTPTIDAIAAQGVNFTNCWAMSECSPSRVCFFTGRYPTRTGVGAPLVPKETLPQSQCSPFEWTTPKVLNAAGYESVLFGKFHLAHNDFNPQGPANLVPNSIGFTNFNGTLLGAPPPIDVTLAGQLSAEKIRYSCGFPVEGNGPAICACLFKGGADGGNECTPGVDALECLAAGGVPLVTPSGDPILDCNSPDAVAAAQLVANNWDTYNGYYVWPRTINLNGVAIPATNNEKETIYARAYADVDQADLAIEFINKQNNKKMGGNWMCTLAFSGDHDPWQQPPEAGVNTPWPITLPYGCGEQVGIDGATALAVERKVSDRIIESFDSQINRVLVQSGLAHHATDGSLVIDAPDTLIVVIGDNGSFLNTVKFPFSPERSKGTIYQTGVCVPLVMAGGPTVVPGRAVDSMVNCVDLFQLWGEVAGIDVQTAKPAGRQLDCFSMLPYLTTAEPAQIRTYNFAEFTQPHLKVEATGGPNAVAGPCLLAGGSICTDTILATQEFCEGQGGTWMGVGGRRGVYDSCCELAAAVPAGDDITLILWPTQCTITNGRWKLVQKFAYGENEVTCQNAIDPDNPVHALEFYDLADCPFANQLFGRGIDNDECDMLKNTGHPATDLAHRPDAMAAYSALNKQLETLRPSLVPIIGDVTMDGNVDGADLIALLSFWNEPSVADFNNDAQTNGNDLAIMIGAWSTNTP